MTVTELAGPAARHGRLAEPVIELLRFELDVQADQLSELQDLLSPGELERAARLRFARDAGRFIAGRGLVRRALAARAGCAPVELRIAEGRAGKPYLPDHPELRFNASGSGGVGLLAIAVGIELGVDLELSAHAFDGIEVARQFFCAGEIAALESLAPAEQPAAFLRCWTRKEAYVKALGRGLHAALDSFEVTLLPGEPAELRWCATIVEYERWTLVDCSGLVGGITSAICYEAHAGIALVSS